MKLGGLQVGDALVGDLDVARDEAGRRLDGADFVVGQKRLSSVVVGQQTAPGGAETWKTDEADGALAGCVGRAVATTDSDRTT